MPPELGKAGCACVVTRLQERFPSPPKRAAAYDAAAGELVEACFTEEAEKASRARMRDPVTGGWSAELREQFSGSCREAMAKVGSVALPDVPRYCVCSTRELERAYPEPADAMAVGARSVTGHATAAERALDDSISGTCLAELARSTDIDAVARSAEAGEKAGQSRVAAARKVLVEAAGKALRLNKAEPVVGYDEEDISRDLNAAYGKLVEAERAYREACRACASELSCDYDRLLILSGGPAQPSPEGPCAAR